MGLTVELALVLVGAFLLLSILASKASSKLGVPSLVLFIAIGMLAGSDGPGGIVFDNYALTKVIGTLALACILFAGGLDTDWKLIRPVLWRGLSLSTVGVVASAALVGFFAVQFLGLSPIEGLLLGAIVSPTDAAAVFGVLRSRSINLRHRINPLLEFESGTNDPLAVFLTASLTQMLANPGGGVSGFLVGLVTQMPIGFVVGFVLGELAVRLINRIRLEYDGLYPVITVALVSVTFGGAHLLGGNEFLAVYVAGIAMGRHNFVHKLSLIQFHDGLAWLMQIVMFLALGLLSYPSQLVQVAGAGIALSLFLMFVARPVSVFLSLGATRMRTGAKLVVSWAGLRGAVPIILATFPLMAGEQKAPLMFNLVTFVVILSVIVQGMTLPAVCRWLGVMRPVRADSQGLTRAQGSELLEVVLEPGSRAAGKMMVELPLPRTALAVLLKRDGERYIPKGVTQLQEGDTLLIATRKGDEDELRAMFAGKSA